MTLTRPARTRRAIALLGAGTVLCAGGAAGLTPGTATASSHREAPGILGAPQYDNTDTYAFVSPDKAGTVTLIGNWIPMQEPGGGPNFYPWATDAAYDFNIDNNHDAVADLTYRWEFTNARTPGAADSITGLGTFLNNNGPVTSLTDPNLLFRQTYDLTLIRPGQPDALLLDNAPAAPSHFGDASMPDYEDLRDEAIRSFGTGAKSFVGQAEDPFFLDLRVFDLLYGGNPCNTEVGNDTLDGYNVNSIALQVPKAQLTAGAEPVIGMWSTTSRKDAGGTYRQVSRLGQPLVNEVVIPYQLKDAFNSIKPESDGVALPYVQKPELASLLKAVCGVPAPTDNRNDLVTVFLTGVPGLNKPATVTPSEQLRLNTSIAPSAEPARLGVLAGDNAGFPNGRRLADDVVDIALQVVGGELVGNPNNLGDAVDKNQVKFGKSFPYLALPESGSLTRAADDDNGKGNDKRGETLLTGGDGTLPTGGLPFGVPALTVGLLLLLAGALALRGARRTPGLATA